MTIAETAYEALKAGKSDDETLAAILAAHPKAKTKMASVRWYRNKLKQDGGATAPKRARKVAKKIAAEKPGMDDETKALLAARREQKRIEEHEQRMKDQRKRLKARGASRDMAAAFLRAYHIFKQRHPNEPTPSPTELQERGYV